MLPKDILRMADEGFAGFLFYDCEVFPEENLVVFKDIDKNEVATVINGEVISGPSGTLAGLIEGKVLVGYNNYGYDDYVLSGLLAGYVPASIKRVNDAILASHRPQLAINPRITSLDCFQQIKYRSGLKKIEANLGMSIEETEVDFNLPRRMDIDEWERTLRYCGHDVDATVDIFKLRWESYFKPKLSVVSMLPRDMQERFLRYNTTTVTAQVLTHGVKANRWATRRFSKSIGREDYDDKLFRRVPEDVKDLWRERGGEVKKAEVAMYGCEFTFGSGGLHGVNTGRGVYRETPGSKIMLLDVASMYPSIILNINGLGAGPTERYRDIVWRRLAAKKTDPVLASALKLVVNSTYGLLKNEYSKLYNPLAAESVCIYGQAALFDLCGRLHDLGYEIIQANTDGVAFYGDPDAYAEAAREWESDFGLTLELSTFERWIQRDVNNYVAVKPGGGVKVKGGDVNKYHDPTDFSGDLLGMDGGFGWDGTNSNGIVARAIVNALVQGKSTEETIVESLGEPILFQIVLQAGKTYRGVVDEEGGRGYQKVNRVFASKSGPRLMKERPDGGTNEFPDMPEHMMVVNGDLSDRFDPSRLDLDYYNRLCRDRLARWPNPWTA